VAPGQMRADDDGEDGREGGEPEKAAHPSTLTLVA